MRKLVGIGMGGRIFWDCRCELVIDGDSKDGCEMNILIYERDGVG